MLRFLGQVFPASDDGRVFGLIPPVPPALPLFAHVRYQKDCHCRILRHEHHPCSGVLQHSTGEVDLVVCLADYVLSGH
jgi:hypothetical protein